MQMQRGPLAWGILLILVGAFLLAQNFGIIPELGAPAVTIGFAIASVVCFALYVAWGRAWGLLFPAFILAGLAMVAYLDSRNIESDLSGSLILWSIAAPFLGVYLTDRQQWWAIIPGGVLLTVGITPLAAPLLPGSSVAALMFVGIGATFLVLYLLSGRRGPTGWAIYPALGCVAAGVLVGVFGPLQKYWPVFFLILPGLWLLYAALRPRGRWIAPSSAPPAPPEPPREPPTEEQA